jgi:hypothetical protein
LQPIAAHTKATRSARIAVNSTVAEGESSSARSAAGWSGARRGASFPVEEVVMDAKEQQLEQEKTERKLDEAQARLRMLEARARERQADGSIAEVTGLKALHDRVRKQFGEWKDADQASFDELRDQVKQAADALSRGADAAGDRLDRFGDASDRWLDAEADQAGAAFQMFDAWLGEEWVEDKEAAAGARKDLRTAWNDVVDKRRALKGAASEKKDQARRDLEKSIAQLKEELQKTTARLKRPAGKPAEQRT